MDNYEKATNNQNSPIQNKNKRKATTAIESDSDNCENSEINYICEQLQGIKIHKLNQQTKVLITMRRHSI